MSLVKLFDCRADLVRDIELNNILKTYVPDQTESGRISSAVNRKILLGAYSLTKTPKAPSFRHSHSNFGLSTFSFTLIPIPIKMPEPPAGPPNRELYALLHISPEASDEEIRKAYRQWAQVYHPDKYQASHVCSLFHLLLLSLEYDEFATRAVILLKLVEQFLLLHFE